MGPHRSDLGWKKRQRRLGESVAGCLLFIAIVLGGSIWAYFKFVHYRPLTQADTNYKTFKEKDNWGAYLEYGRRFRDHFGLQVRNMVSHNQQLITRFKKGEYKNDPDRFENETKEFINALRDDIIDFNGQQVPSSLERSHKGIAKAHRLCYESVLALQAAQASEGAERDKFLKDAERLLRDAWKVGNEGVQEYKRAWHPV